jgi:AcrR family transcriptional regulator
MDPAGRREQLLDAALALALERGFHAVSIDGVARAAGVTRPVVYGQFASSADQLGPVLPCVPSAGASVDPDELLVQGLTAYLTAVRDDPATWRVVLLPPEGAPPELAQRVRVNHRVVLSALRELATWGLAARGEPAPDVELFARSLLLLSEGAARMVLADPDRYPVERFTGFARALLAALHAEPPHP